MLCVCTFESHSVEMSTAHAAMIPTLSTAHAAMIPTLSTTHAAMIPTLSDADASERPGRFLPGRPQRLHVADTQELVS